MDMAAGGVTRWSQDSRFLPLAPFFMPVATMLFQVLVSPFALFLVFLKHSSDHMTTLNETCSGPIAWPTTSIQVPVWPRQPPFPPHTNPSADIEVRGESQAASPSLPLSKSSCPEFVSPAIVGRDSQNPPPGVLRIKGSVNASSCGGGGGELRPQLQSVGPSTCSVLSIPPCLHLRDFLCSRHRLSPTSIMLLKSHGLFVALLRCHCPPHPVPKLFSRLPPCLSLCSTPPFSCTPPVRRAPPLWDSS